MSALTERMHRITRIVKPFPFLYSLSLLCMSPLKVWLSLKWVKALGGLFSLQSLATVK